jgi:hypothetical protein
MTITGPRPSGDTAAAHEGTAALWAAVAAAALALPFALGSLDFALDDAWIHLAYAQSVRLGDGFSYNPGDWELGCSSPLWVALLVVWPWRADPVMPVVLLGLLLHAVTAWATAALALELGRARASTDKPLPLRSLTLFAGVLAAATPTLLEGAASGMEVPLCAALISATAWAMVAARPRAAAILGGLAVLARPETLVMTVVTGGALAWARRRRGGATAAAVRAPLAAAAAALATMAAWSAACLAIAGQPFPNAMYVKGQGGSLAGLGYVAAEVLPWQPIVVSLGGLGLVGLALRGDLRERRPELAALLAGVVATTVAIAIGRPLHPGILFYESRYFAPLAAVPAAIVPLGLVGLRRAWMLALALPVGAVAGLQAADVRSVLRGHQADTHLMHTAVARDVAALVPADAVIAAEAAGALRFHTARTVTVVDLVGLNDHLAARVHFDRDAKRCHWVSRGPTHLVVPAEWTGLLADVFASTPLHAWDDPAYTQVDPPRPLRTVLLRVDRVAPAWAHCRPSPAAPTW